MRHTNRGVTLIEIIAASVIGALLAGGTLTAFVLAVTMTRGSVTTVEAATYAAQTMERFRNKIACSDPQWFDAGCNFLNQSLTADSFPGSMSAANSTFFEFDPSRQYQVQAADCDGNGSNGDCYQMTVTVSWTSPS